jgi:hypothetical protein
MNNHPGGRRDKAIISIVGKSVSYDSDGDTIIKWHSEDVPQPSEADIDAKVAEYEIEWNAQEYARNRKAEYPDWGTQLNKIYDDGLTKWKSEMVDPIKAKYPKPE